MKAWQFVDVGEPLVRTELPDPVPGPGEVAVDIRAAGLCHTDISFLDGDVPGMPTHTPIVLGHEISGVISALGADVTGFEIGDAVGLAPVSHVGPGVGRDGGYAEKTLATVEELVRVPPSVTFAQAAAATDAGATAYHAVHAVGEVEKGMRVGIVGLGGLGQIGARVAVLQGAEVHVSDIRADLEPVAAGLGVTGFSTDATEFARLGLDVVVDFAGIDTTRTAIAAARPGGRVVQIGSGKPEATISVVDLVVRSIQVFGSLGGTKDDVIAVYALLDGGGLDPVISTVGFDDIADGLERLRRGESAGRTVATFG
jgi:propanol-preferring alcohol dehydrogenase